MKTLNKSFSIKKVVIFFGFPTWNFMHSRFWVFTLHLTGCMAVSSWLIYLFSLYLQLELCLPWIDHHHFDSMSPQYQFTEYFELCIHSFFLALSLNNRTFWIVEHGDLSIFSYMMFSHYIFSLTLRSKFSHNFSFCCCTKFINIVIGN
ncbi:hypothetical protein HS088_TW01G00765 [Tripterygium wilfordii]|uniref:Uncharacterized protein n=1 Tax=Tripterygium wilfordii TaxID=458696 RepID=A0A7J7E2M9_TRIWF|nr:hypothetical protein HS088_TW01G00765 [Tripterygium wilfordii]